MKDKQLTPSEIGRALRKLSLERSTPAERSDAARRGALKNWASLPESERKRRAKIMLEARRKKAKAK